MENTLQRIKKFVDYKGISVRVFEQSIGMSNGSFASQLKNNKTIGVDKLENILHKYREVNPEWLLTGKGEMLKNTGQQSTLQSERKLIPFYDINTEAGTLQISNMEVAEEPEEMIDAGDWFRDADCAMRVHGDSMFPLYKSGSIVVMREVHDKKLIQYGQDYVIITSEYRAIKRLQKSAEKGYWLACSTNEDTWEKGELAGRLIHEPFDVPIDCVYKLFRVLGCVTRTESSRVVYAHKLK